MPIILWLLGVPLTLVLVLWFFEILSASETIHADMAWSGISPVPAAASNGVSPLRPGEHPFVDHHAAPKKRIEIPQAIVRGSRARNLREKMCWS